MSQLEPAVDRGVRAEPEPSGARLIEEAQGLASRAEGLLGRAAAMARDGDGFRLRLARAHALCLLDQLNELVAIAAPAPSGPGALECSVPEPANSQVQPRRGPNAWRSG